MILGNDYFFLEDFNLWRPLLLDFDIDGDWTLNFLYNY